MTRYFLLVLAIVSCVTVSFSRAAEEKKDNGFVSIFDGKTLDGWEGDPKFWSVKDGAITGETTKDSQPAHNTFLFWKTEVGDFELHCKCREVGGNSGIQFRSKRLPDYIAAGYQADMGPGKNHNGKIYDEHGKRGFLASVGEKSVIKEDGKKEVISTDADAAKYANSLDLSQWIDYTVIAKGNHFQTFINGKLISDCTDEDKTHAATNGVLAFQLHKEKSDMTVQFKDIEFKKLD